MLICYVDQFLGHLDDISEKQLDLKGDSWMLVSDIIVEDIHAHFAKNPTKACILLVRWLLGRCI